MLLAFYILTLYYIIFDISLRILRGSYASKENTILSKSAKHINDTSIHGN